MTDADLIYNACLRAERRLEEQIPAGYAAVTHELTMLMAALLAVHTLREEIGNGLTKEGR